MDILYIYVDIFEHITIIQKPISISSINIKYESSRYKNLISISISISTSSGHSVYICGYIYDIYRGHMNIKYVTAEQ